MKGKLFLIPTPIGNLKEITPRILETITLCDYIACEDTRNTKKLLTLLNIQKPTISCHEHNETRASIKIIEDLKSGKNIGYMSDAGNPCISDPGEKLVYLAIKENINIVPLSGPSAFIDALIASGLNTSHFLFFGFLESKSSKRKQELNELKNVKDTIIFYEAPHRIKETLNDLLEVFGNRNIVIARELTKIHEEFIRDRIENIINSNREFIGELVLVVEGNKIDEAEIDDAQIIKDLKALKSMGLSSKDAITSYSYLKNIPKNKLYKLTIKKSD